MAKKPDEGGLNQIVARQVRLWETRRLGELQREMEEKKVEEPIKPYIAISREVGSGGRSIGESVANQLEWEFFDRELVEHMAKVARVRQNVVESLDEKTMDGIKEWISTLVDRNSLDHDYYLKHLMTVLMTIARHGNAVIVGRGASFVLPPEHGLRVRVIAPTEKRIKEMQNILDKRHQETRKIVLERDKQMKEFIRKQHHKNVSDPVHYDMILNTGLLKLDTCVDMIVAATRDRFR
jgi:cytidylate kinase